MNGYDIYRHVAARLGYTEAVHNSGDRILLERAKELICQIASDLCLAGIEDMTSKTDYTEAETEALICGVSMLFAISEGDGEKGRLYSELYNAKRAALLCRISEVSDVLPTASDGVI